MMNKNLLKYPFISRALLLIAIALITIYPQAKAQEKKEFEPFWIAVTSAGYDMLNPPSVDLSSIALSDKEPQWRTVNFVDNAYMEQKDVQTVGTLLTIDCARREVVGGMPTLQPGDWEIAFESERAVFPKEQEKFSQRMVQLVCSVPLPLLTPEWVDLNKEAGDQFESNFNGPFTAYDRNSLKSSLGIPRLHTITLRDRTQHEGVNELRSEEYYNYTFNCQNGTAKTNARYRFEKQYQGNGLTGASLNHLYSDDSGGLSSYDLQGNLIYQESAHTITIDEYQSPQLRFIFNKLCQHQEQ